jgi:hypothetical protein
MAKKVTFGAKPIERSAAAEQWIDGKATESVGPTLAGATISGEPTENGDPVGGGEPMKRLTIDLPASLHKRVKSGCAQRGVKMADEIRRLLEAHFSET